jgi:hypothetical protein
MTHVQITIRFPVATAFHTTGNRRRLWADRALALSTEGTPILPATTIKGYLRERAEALLRTWGQRVCLPPVPTGMCSEKELCLACQVFGNPRQPSPLRFRDGQFVRDPDTMVRSGVSISRRRRAALPNASSSWRLQTHSREKWWQLLRATLPILSWPDRR